MCLEQTREDKASRRFSSATGDESSRRYFRLKPWLTLLALTVLLRWTRSTKPRSRVETCANISARNAAAHKLWIAARRCGRFCLKRMKNIGRTRRNKKETSGCADPNSNPEIFLSPLDSRFVLFRAQVLSAFVCAICGEILTQPSPVRVWSPAVAAKHIAGCRRFRNKEFPAAYRCAPAR